VPPGEPESACRDFIPCALGTTCSLPILRVCQSLPSSDNAPRGPDRIVFKTPSSSTLDSKFCAIASAVFGVCLREWELGRGSICFVMKCIGIVI